MKERELIADLNKELIRKRAKFKDNLNGYIKQAWNKKGIITTSEHTKYLYLRFDKPINNGCSKIKSLIIEKDSILILENEEEQKKLKFEKWKISTLHKMLSRFQEMQEDLNEFTQEEQDYILEMHNEHATLQHCLRFGEQALYEILEDIEK